MKRRKFIKTSLQAGGAWCFSMLPGCKGQAGQSAFSKNKSSPRVVMASNNLVRDGKKKLIGEQVDKMLQNAMENLVQVNKPQLAWQQLFNKHDVVGIKINCLAGRGLSSSHELVQAIIEGLKMAGVAERNIIVWDRANRDLEKAGYPILTNGNRVKYYGTDYVGYSYDIYEYGQVGSMLSNILVRQCTAIVNVPILKDHGIVGITNALKNYFGAIHNPNKYHDNRGDPYVADVNMLPEIRSKTRITICDLLTAQYEGGPPFMPQWAWQHNSIMIGFDPVALDTIGWKIIETKRKEHGLPTLKEAGREPTYIATAADETHQLGCNDVDKIQVIQV